MYGKIFEEIFDSSLMLYGGDTAYVFMCLIVLCDKDGYVRYHPTTLAKRIGKDVRTVQRCLGNLLAVDPSSSSSAADGRRIVSLAELTGQAENRGWRIVNHEKYRSIASNVDRAAQSTARSRTWRERNKTKKTNEINDLEQGDVRGRKGTQRTPSDAYADAYPDVNNILSDFERCWLKFPKRPGNNKKKAYKAWCARLKEGVVVEEMEQGLDRYIRFCEDTSKVGTEYVKMAATFFGPDNHYEALWETPQQPKEKKSELEKLVDGFAERRTKNVLT